MTESEQIDYLAKNIMQWHEKISPTYTGENIDWFDAHEKWVARKQNGSTLWQESIIAWNPLHSWDCFRQVEEKVMENEALFEKFEFCGLWDDAEGNPIMGAYAKSDLPTRANALIDAHKSLND